MSEAFVLCMSIFSYHIFVRHFHIKHRTLNQLCSSSCLDKSENVTMLTFECLDLGRKERSVYKSTHLKTELRVPAGWPVTV